MAKTYLQLPPDLGGVRYGPFRGPVVFGSDAKACQMVLDPSHGIFPIHATLAPLDADRYALTPASPDCKVFLMPRGQGQVWPLTSPVQTEVGATVILGTPTGPRFLLQQDRAAAVEAHGEAGLLQAVDRGLDAVFQPAGGGIGGEIARRAQANLLTTGPFRDLYRLRQYVRTGRFNNPVYLVGAAIAILGSLGTGVVSCSGLAYLLLDVLGLGR